MAVKNMLVLGWGALKQHSALWKRASENPDLWFINSLCIQNVITVGDHINTANIQCMIVVCMYTALLMYEVLVVS